MFRLQTSEDEHSDQEIPGCAEQKMEGDLLSMQRWILRLKATWPDYT
jgi:hypothetical protein